jgi:hypothetical protein
MTIARYVICVMYAEPTPIVDSDQTEFDACVSAVDGLVNICATEEKYENLIENYIEWESAISQHTLRQMVSFDIGYNEVQAARKLAARKLANFLASARLYLDSLPKDAKRILPDNKGALAELKEAPSIQYDARFSYRLMEALRNYSQHAALPIHGITTHASRDTIDEAYTLSFAVLPTLDREQLAQDGSFKKTVLDEISKLEKIELKPMVREYIEGLSAVHNAFRMITNPKRKSWNDRLGSAAKRFIDQHPDESETALLAILPVDADNNKAAEEVYLAGPMTDYLEHLQNRYGTMVNFAKRRVNF